MSKRIKIVCCALVTLLCATFLMGCNFRRGDKKEYDRNRTQLFVGNYDGGLGSAWLDEIKRLFEIKYPKVEVVYENYKDEYADSELIKHISTRDEDLYFLNGITYANYVRQNKLADISSVVTKKIEGENMSIADKMHNSLKKYYNLGSEESPKFYAIPFFDSIFGTVYDVDLFEGKYYFNTDGEIMLTSENKVKSAGPNGITGDFDDGQPKDIEEWQTLLAALKMYGITPYIWNGNYNYYRQRYLTSIWADHEGKANFDLNMSFKGTYKNSQEEIDIDITNAYLLQKQQGKLNALKMAEHIVANNYYDNDSFDSITTHTQAQKLYIQSAESTHRSRIAMILEGGWWENEARDFFNEMERINGSKYAYGTRKFAMMLPPKFQGGNDKTTLISSTGNSVVCVNQSSSNKDIAFNYLEFVHSEEALRIFTRYTGAVRPYDYTLEKSDLNQMTHFGKSMWELYSHPNTEISHVTLYSHDAFVEKAAYLGSNWWWKSSENATNEPFYVFRNTSVNAQKYFEGLSKHYSKTSWESEMKSFWS